MVFVLSLWMKKVNFGDPNIDLCGPGSSVGIPAGYGLDGPEIESR
jgi:hypothetical protein